MGEGTTGREVVVLAGVAGNCCSHSSALLPDFIYGDKSEDSCET